MPDSAAERGTRLRQIREALDIKQDEFADRLNAAALSLGLVADYTGLGISQRETGRRAMDIEDFVIASFVDPHHRTILWLAFGREIPLADRLASGKMMPRPTTKAPGGAAGGTRKSPPK